jgi:hypothetical protein
MTVPVKIAVRIMKSSASSVTTWPWPLEGRLKTTRVQDEIQTLLRQVNERFFVNLCATLQTSPWHLQNVVRCGRIRIRQLIENDDEWNLSGLATGFAAGDPALRLLKSRSIDQNDVLLLTRRIGETQTHRTSHRATRSKHKAK